MREIFSKINVTQKYNDHFEPIIFKGRGGPGYYPKPGVQDKGAPNKNSRSRDFLAGIMALTGIKGG